MHEQLQTAATINLATNTDVLLTTKQAAAWCNFTPRFLEARRARGNGPKYIRVSARAIRYRLSDLKAWLESKIKQSEKGD